MTNSNVEDTRYDPVWRAAEPYMRARKNDIHIPLSYAWAQRLLNHYDEADRDICLLAILLHDIGWYSIDNDRIMSEGFSGKNMLQADVRYLHEAEGVRLAQPLLRATGWSPDIVDAVCEIIDGHDTRETPHHLNDRIVRDADKLWRYQIAGVAVICDWMKMTPKQYVKRLDDHKHRLETAKGREFAADELERTRKALRVHLI